MRTLAQNYGDLRHNPESRVRFIRDTQAMLEDVGKELVRLGVISDWSIKRWPGHLSYAGGMVGYFISPDEKRAISVSCTHKRDTPHSRPDGIYVYTQYREHEKNGRHNYTVVKDNRGREKIPVLSYSGWGIVSQIQRMFLTH